MNRNPDHLIALHVTGPDRPAITATLSNIVANEGATIIDLGQSVLHGYLNLSWILEVPPGSDALRKLLFAASELGLKLEVGTIDLANGKKPCPGCGGSLVVTILGNLEDGTAVAKTTGYLGGHRLNIRDIKTLSQQRLQGIELIVDVPNDMTLTTERLQELRGGLLGVAVDLGIDLAVQKDGVFRRNKRLVCMDVDSTFIQMEVIDELAKLAGTGDKVVEITERAMAGELDFAGSLRERVGLLAGLPLKKAMSLTQAISMTPGAEELVATLKALGLKIGLVSGGFTFFVEHLREKFALDFAFANELEIDNGVITGRVVGSIVDPERKAQVLRDMARIYRIGMDQCVAIGDGANDIKMLQTAGLGIAFHAKPRLQEIADLSLNKANLDSILFLMGFMERDVADLRPGK